METRGTLFVVATPIGNLTDISTRALETLKTVDLILSEDTRETYKLLSHFEIQTKQISYRDQNHDRVINEILERLSSGQNLALVCDSGTPTISDPGFKLVKTIKEAGFKVKPIPGPSAIIASLSVSGLPTDKFVFLGFLPKKKNARKELLETFGKTPTTLVIYESPFRVRKLLKEIKSALGDRIVCLAKDISKKHEEISTDTVSKLIQAQPKEKGEYVVLIAKEGFQYEPNSIEG